MSNGYLSPIHPMDIQSIQAYIESHLEALSRKIHLYPIPHGIWQESPLSWCSTLQVIYFVNLFNYTFYFHITYHLAFLSLGLE